MRRHRMTRMTALLLCLTLMILITPHQPAEAEGALSALVSLSKDSLLVHQRITATVQVQGGSPPYWISYEWIIHPFDADPDSRAVFYESGSTSDLSFSITPAVTGEGQLYVEVYDSAQNKVFALGEGNFAVHGLDDIQDELAPKLLQGRWNDIGETGWQMLTLTLAADGRARMEAAHPAWLGGYKLITGNATIDKRSIRIAIDAGGMLNLGYSLRYDETYDMLWLKLRLADGTTEEIEYNPDHVDEDLAMMPLQPATPAPLSPDHLRLLGTWHSTAALAGDDVVSCVFTEDGRMQLEILPNGNALQATRINAQVQSVNHEAIVYLTDHGHASYEIYSFLEDGRTLQLFGALLTRLP